MEIAIMECVFSNKCSEKNMKEENDISPTQSKGNLFKL